MSTRGGRDREGEREVEVGERCRGNLGGEGVGRVEARGLRARGLRARGLRARECGKRKGGGCYDKRCSEYVTCLVVELRRTDNV